jgi:hypothetical protein
MSARTNVHSFPGDVEFDGTEPLLENEIPLTTDYINTTTVGVSAQNAVGLTVFASDKVGTDGVDFSFTMPKGLAPSLTLGTVVNGTSPVVVKDGNGVLNFTIPNGADGDTHFTKSGSDISYTTGNVGIGDAPPTGKKLYVNGTLGVGSVDLSAGFSPLIFDTQFTGSSSFGYSVGISGDGNTIIVGAYSFNSANVYRYDTSTSSWDTGTKFTGSGGFGWDVDISGDGNAIIVGAQFGNAKVYRYDGSSWDTGTQFTGSSALGYSVGMSGDGNTIVVGATGNYAKVYRYDTSWDSGTRFDGPTGSAFGRAVSISGDGDAIIVGAYAGSYANVYRYDTSWDSGTQLTETGGSGFGWDVDISGDGNAIIVGATGNYAKVYRYDTSWDSGTQFNGSGLFGRAVSISGDGNAIIVGAYSSNYANVYRYDTSWDTGTQVLGTGGFGRAVSISGDGNAIIVGAYNEDYANVYTSSKVLDVSKQIQADGSLLSFTGQHICTPHGPMEQGLVVSANKNAYTTLNGPLFAGARAIQSSESLPVVSLSTQENDPSVFGVVDHLEEGGTKRVQDRGGIIVRKTKTLGDDRVIVNSLGEGAIWVVDTGGPLKSGDFITSSNVPGYGQRQSSDIRKSYTIGKITMDCDFNPPDVPVQVATTDENGKLKWEDTGETEKAYKTKTVEVEGSGHVYKAAYVGCTYHCG